MQAAPRIACGEREVQARRHQALTNRSPPAPTRCLTPVRLAPRTCGRATALAMRARRGHGVSPTFSDRERPPRCCCRPDPPGRRRVPGVVVGPLTGVAERLESRRDLCGVERANHLRSVGREREVDILRQVACEDGNGRAVASDSRAIGRSTAYRPPARRPRRSGSRQRDPRRESRDGRAACRRRAPAGCARLPRCCRPDR